MNWNILKSWQQQWPKIKSTIAPETGHGVLDASAFNTMEVDELFDTLNYAQTTAGQSVIYRSLTQPMADAQAILDKQQAIRDLQANPELREHLHRIVQHAAQGEQHLYLLLYGTFLGSFGTARDSHQIEGYGYKQYTRAVRFVLSLFDEMQSLIQPQSVYLQQIVQKIKQFGDSNDYALMVGPVFNSEQGLQSAAQRAERGWSPATIFRPTLFKPMLIVLLAVLAWSIMHFFPTDMFQVTRDGLSVASVFFLPLLLMVYIPSVGGYDRDHCIIPLRDIYRNSEALGELLDGLGQLDELLSLLHYAEQFGNAMCLPEIVSDAESHQMQLQAAKNPVLAKQNPDYVANDFQITDNRLICITGPNSGGKTAFCKTVTQIQLLAQIGSFVPAQYARLSIADHIFYQAPSISHLDDGEGRFGTELKRTRDIFLASSAHSLVVLDEMAEGTTFEEKMQSSLDVLDGFYRKGNSTILITHNHQLVEKLQKKRIATPQQVEFSDDQPTFKLIAGISRVSHADRIAERIGFSKHDIDRYLAHS
jgi:DNA mismatch repair protein MutS